MIFFLLVIWMITASTTNIPTVPNIPQTNILTIPNIPDTNILTVRNIPETNIVTVPNIPDKYHSRSKYSSVDSTEWRLSNPLWPPLPGTEQSSMSWFTGGGGNINKQEK